MMMQFTLAFLIFRIINGHLTAQFNSIAWIQQDRVHDKHKEFRVLLGVAVDDPQALESYFWQVSDPSHHLYGRHLSVSEANDLTKPPKGAVPAIKKWLASHGHENSIFDHSTNTLSINLSVEKVEKLFDTQLYEFSHRRSERRILRAATSVTIPENVQSILSFLNINAHPLGLGFQLPKRALKDSVDFNGLATPTFLRELYNIPKDRIATNSKSIQCVPEFYDEEWSMSDLEKFNSMYDLSPPNVVQKGTRTNDPKAASSEASLDLQYITAMAPNATTYVWTMNGTNPNSKIDEPFFEWGKQILSDPNPPLVISISYSDDEEHIFQSSEEYARSFDVLLMKMGARGITVLMSSGDDGVAGQRPSVAHLTESERCLENGPQWPTGSPYLTTVGATMMLRGSVDEFFQTTHEVVCSGAHGGLITSGGGFAKKYGVAPYQIAEVKRYIDQYTQHMPEAFFNRSGRGYPDLSAFGASYNIIVDGSSHSVAGTSASTPVVAAMVTLWNDRRMNAGKPPLGFINPLLYRIARENNTAFNDIVIGSNAASNGGRYTCENGFHAAPGWDATTGLGTPNCLVLDELVFNAEFSQETKPPEEPPTETPAATNAPNTSANESSTAGLPDFLTTSHTLSIYWVLFLGAGWIVVVAVFASNLYGRFSVGKFTKMEPLATEDELTPRNIGESEDEKSDEEDEKTVDVV